MKIFGIGLQKTGTTTLGYCLKELGYNHLSGYIYLLEWVNEGKWDQLFELIDQYDSFDDVPWFACYKELDKRYPGSKFILTIRKSPEIWYESLCKHVINQGPYTERYGQLTYGYHLPFGQEEDHISTYNQHIINVKEYFKSRPSDLLILDFTSPNSNSRLLEFLEIGNVDLSIPILNASNSRSKLDFAFRSFTHKAIKRVLNFFSITYPVIQISKKLVSVYVIEKKMKSCDLIYDCKVFSIPNKIWDNVLVMCVHPLDSFDLKEFVDFLYANLFLIEIPYYLIEATSLSDIKVSSYSDLHNYRYQKLL